MKPLVKLATALLIGMLATGCHVVQAGVFIVTVKHYHGEGPTTEPAAAEAPEVGSGVPQLPPRVRK